MFGYSHYFDKPWDSHSFDSYVNLGINFTSTGIAMFNMFSSCIQQYRDVHVDPWYLDYNLLSEDMPVESTNDKPKVKSKVYDTPLKNITAAVTLALDANNIYRKGRTKYYYFDFGKAIGLFVSQVIVTTDAWAGTELIPSVDPWELYLTQAP